MNKKEVSEIKKNFTENCGFLTTHRILTAYIDVEKNIRCQTVQSRVTMSEEEAAVLQDTLRHVLSTRVGKALVEYPFPNEAYAEEGGQHLLYALLQSGLEDQTLVESYLLRMAERVRIPSAYAVITACCTYTIRTKDKNDEYNETADEEYRFLLTALCPANTGSDGFVFDEFENLLRKKMNTELIVSKMPTDGFLYPVFSNRAPDINSVMYFTKTPDKPNISMVEDFLSCQFVMSAQDEKSGFQDVLRTVAGDELNYMMVTTVNERLTEMAEDAKKETEVATLDDKGLRTLLSDVGVSEERLSMVEPVYQQALGGVPVRITNLVEPKTVLSTPEITVHIKKTATDKVRTSVIGGRRCLLIDLDDPCVEVNGLPMQLYSEETQPETSVADPV